MYLSEMPSVYERDIADLILERLSAGETLAAICRNIQWSAHTVRGWRQTNIDGFGDRYRIAREMQVETWADDLIETSEDEDLDVRARSCRISTKQWLMARYMPRQFGDKLGLVGGDGEGPLQVAVLRMSDAEPVEPGAERVPHGAGEKGEG